MPRPIAPAPMTATFWNVSDMRPLSAVREGGRPRADGHRGQQDREAHPVQRIHLALRDHPAAGRRAYGPELDAKHPSAHGTATTAASMRLVPSGHTSRLSAMLAMAIMLARDAPIRSMWRVSSTLPIKPKAPNHMKISPSWPGVMPIFA